MKKVLLPLLAGVLTMSMLSACGNSSEGSGGKVKIEFFQNKTEAKATFDKLIAKFNEENPTIKVSQVNPPDAETVLKTRVAKKDVPDVIGLGATDTYSSLAKSGLFEDFTNDPMVKNIQPAYVDMLKKQTGLAELNGIPFSANASGILYNKAIFKDLGIEVPKTWDELIAAADKIKAAGKNPFYFTLKDSWTTLVPFNSFTPNIVGLDFFNKRKEGSTTFKDAFREVAEKQLKLTEYGQKDQFGKGYNDGNTAFAKGDAAMYIQGVWAIPEIQKANPSIELGIFPLPATNDPSKNMLVSGVDTLLTVSKSSKHKEEAKKFIEFLLKSENSQQYINEQKAFSAVQGVTQSDPSVADLNGAFESGKLVDFADHYIPGAMKVDTLIQDFMQKKDIDQYLSTLDTEWDKVADRK
ncbi:ABC transporter substrate-binding protein [Paenibacillus caui]|uniref:ABC transporter substrate-binding protein n=1 Tax=Paenibacillus caui TaxID=2873927 RepID=UPI001CA8BB6B|nr:extracellular solute-binding protein [Paenibacillus caui]